MTKLNQNHLELQINCEVTMLHPILYNILSFEQRIIAVTTITSYETNICNKLSSVYVTMKV
jgi:hypothetical protein